MILIDDREPIKDKLQKYFTELNIETRVERLPVGDIVDMDHGICIERKEISDFNSSIKDGRLWEQAQNMKANFACNYFIVVGTYKQLFFQKKEFMHLNVHVLLGAMASLTAKYGIPVMTVDNQKQLVYLCSKLFEKQGQPVDIVNRMKMTDTDIYTNMLAVIPGIGYKKAKLILSKMSFQDIILDNGSQLKEVDGIGDKLCQSVKKYVYISDTFINVGGKSDIATNKAETNDMKIIKITTGSGGEGRVRKVRIFSRADIKSARSRGYPECTDEKHYPDCPTVKEMIDTFEKTGDIPGCCYRCDIGGLNGPKRLSMMKAYIGDLLAKKKAEEQPKEETFEEAEEQPDEETTEETDEVEKPTKAETPTEAEEEEEEEEKEPREFVRKELKLPLKWRSRKSGKKLFRKPGFKVEMYAEATHIYIKEGDKYKELVYEKEPMSEEKIAAKYKEIFKL